MSLDLLIFDLLLTFALLSEQKLSYLLFLATF